MNDHDPGDEDSGCQRGVHAPHVFQSPYVRYASSTTSEIFRLFTLKDDHESLLENAIRYACNLGYELSEMRLLTSRVSDQLTYYQLQVAGEACYHVTRVVTLEGHAINIRVQPRVIKWPEQRRCT